MTAADATAGQPFIIERKGEEVAAQQRVRVVKRGRGALYLCATLDYYTGDDQTPAQSSDS